jgi:salicylate hydroxylase
MYDREPLQTWTHGRSVLLGDAAHPMLQYLAQGACQAIEDGDCLAYSLDRARAADQDLTEGFGEYERHRVERAARTQRRARVWGDIWHCDGVARVLMDAYFRERDPADLRHVAPLYGAPATCAHTEDAPTVTSPLGLQPHPDVVVTGAVPTPITRK